MHKTWVGALAALWAAGASAANADKFEIPYFGADVQYLLTDSQRGAGNGLGYQFKIGVPLEDPRNAVELRFHDGKYSRSDGRDDYQTGMFVDYVRDFGAFGAGGGFIGGLKPFASLGLGLLQEDVRYEKHMHAGLALGGGLLVPLGSRGIALRLDARAQAQSNSTSVPGASSLVDYLVSAGVQIPMTWFYDKPMGAAAAAVDCPVAVVDTETGRRDCVTDSDQDGVGDTLDQCPGTPSGTAVDANGCVKPVASGDEDKDGIADARDQCPGTPAGLAVNALGCVVAQKSALAGVTFLPNSPQLTDEGRVTLDAVAATLKTQRDLKVEIAGHTDAVGSEAFNTLLSQQRADAVRAYLVGQGVEENRMTAVGYGELEPVASNDNEEGRKANRRVEFRITTE